MSRKTLSRVFPPDGVIFDFDGVLANTEEPQIQAWIQTIQSLGIVPNERRIRLLSGYADEEMAQRLLGRDPAAIRGAVLAKEAIFSHIAPNPLPCPGAMELLKSLSQNDLPVTIVSSTPAAVINERLTTWGWRRWVKYVVGGGPDICPKPSPAPYHMALETMGLEPWRCVVVEDTLPGLEAARRAGCITVAITGTLAAGDLWGHADYVIEDLMALVILFGLRSEG